jgi:hypothetical protein
MRPSWELASGAGAAENSGITALDKYSKRDSRTARRISRMLTARSARGHPRSLCDLEHELAAHVPGQDRLESIRRALEGNDVMDLHPEMSVVEHPGEASEPIGMGGNASGARHPSIRRMPLGRPALLIHF